MVFKLPWLMLIKTSTVILMNDVGVMGGTTALTRRTRWTATRWSCRRRTSTTSPSRQRRASSSPGSNSVLRSSPSSSSARSTPSWHSSTGKREWTFVLGFVTGPWCRLSWEGRWRSRWRGSSARGAASRSPSRWPRTLCPNEFKIRGSTKSTREAAFTWVISVTYLVVVGGERNHAYGERGQEGGEDLVEEPPAQDEVDSDPVETIGRLPQGVLLVGDVVADHKILGEIDRAQVVELLGEQPREVAAVALRVLIYLMIKSWRL